MCARERAPPTRSHAAVSVPQLITFFLFLLLLILILLLLLLSLVHLHREATSSALFFKHNSALGPPYNVIVDTNFINFSIKNKMDLVKGMMDCLYAQCVPHITDCVMAELEKLGQKYRVALRVAKVRDDTTNDNTRVPNLPLKRRC